MPRAAGVVAVNAPGRFARRDLLSLRAFFAAGPAAAPRPPAAPRPLVGLTGAAGPAPPRALPVLRPPGALEEAAFLARCTRCDACRVACPHGAVRPAPARLRGAAGTPVIDPLEAPCRGCPDVPCAAACPTGALRPLPGAVMGRAVVQAHDCLATTGTCATCVERCPVPGALRLEAGRPVVDAARCTGCGVCQHVCPSPRNAIIILPALRRGA